MGQTQKLKRFTITKAVADLIPGDVFEQAWWNESVFLWSRSPAYEEGNPDSRLRGIMLEYWGESLEGNMEWLPDISLVKSNHFKNQRMVKEKHAAWRQKRGQEKHAAHEAIVRAATKEKEPVNKEQRIEKPKRVRKSVPTKIIY